MQQPNNILGLEYLKAIRTMALPITPLAVARKGAGHDEAGENAVPSASELRLRLCRGDEIGAFTTQEAAEVFQREKAAGRIAADRERYELLMLSRLRFLQEEDFLSLPDAGDGLGLRLYHAVQGEQSFEGILAAASTRRCPLARVRRMCVCAALGLRAGDRKGLPPYARVLAFNDKGRELLHDASEKRETDPGNLIGTIPLIIKPAHVRRLDTIAQHVFELGVRAHDFHSLLYPGNGKESCGEDWRRTPAIC